MRVLLTAWNSNRQFDEHRQRHITTVIEHFRDVSELDARRKMLVHLLGFTEEKAGATSLAQAKKLLKHTYINIFDYVERRYHLRYESLSALREDIRKHKDRAFRLQAAKASPTLRLLLQRIF